MSITGGAATKEEVEGNIVVEEIKSSFSLKVTVVGIIFLILAVTVVPIWSGIVAGMFGVWGINLIFFSLISYGYFWYKRQQWEDEFEEADL